MATDAEYEIESQEDFLAESDGEEASSRLSAEAETSTTQTGDNRNAGGGKATSASFDDLYKNELKKHDVSKISDLPGLKILEKKEIPLSRTEQLMVKSVTNALDSGDLQSVQDMLATLAENPKMVDRVMGAVREAMDNRNFLNNVSWEQGKDSNGNSFVRLRLYQADSASKSSGGTEVTIGSDGRNSASYTKRWDSHPIQMDPAAALNHIMGPLRKTGERNSIQYK